MPDAFDHVWWWRSRLPERKVRFPDGFLTFTSRYAVRRAKGGR